MIETMQTKSVKPAGKRRLKTFECSPLEMAALEAETAGRRRADPGVTESEIIRECIVEHLKNSVYFVNAIKAAKEHPSFRTALQTAIRLIDAVPDLAAILSTPEARSDNKNKMIKTGTTNLYEYQPSGTYFVHARVNGRLVRKSLRTKSYEIAQTKLKELIERERTAPAKDKSQSYLASGI